MAAKATRAGHQLGHLIGALGETAGNVEQARLIP
jgi:hypothetical protein